MSKKYYVMLENTEIHSATANSNIFTNGFPALTNFIGFAEFIKYKINLIENSLIEKVKISVVINKINFHKIHSKFQIYRKIDKVDNSNLNASTVEEYKANLNLNLILKLELDEDNLINDSEIDTINFIKDFFDKNRYNFKIAGGKVFTFKETITSDYSNILKKLKNYKQSFILEKSEYEFENMSEDEIVNVLSGKTYGKHFLLQTGYNLLEDFQESNFSRNNEETATAYPTFDLLRVRKIASYLFEQNYLDIFNFFEHKYLKDKKSLNCIFSK